MLVLTQNRHITVCTSSIFLQLLIGNRSIEPFTYLFVTHRLAFSFHAFSCPALSVTTQITRFVGVPRMWTSVVSCTVVAMRRAYSQENFSSQGPGDRSPPLRSMGKPPTASLRRSPPDVKLCKSVNAFPVQNFGFND